MDIPSSITINEHVSIILSRFKVPIYLKFNLEDKLKEFFKYETQIFYDSFVETSISRLTSNDKLKFLKFWNLKLKTSIYNNNNSSCTLNNDENLKFTKTYHDLIHSEFMPIILNKERDYMIEINDLIIQRDKNLEHLEEIQQAKLDDALKLNSSTENIMPDSYISKLAQDHCELNELEKSKWDSKIINLKETQKREFILWLNEINENEYLRKKYLNEYLSQQQHQYQQSSNSQHVMNLEESYTIQLGAQLKTTHNLRLIKCDILDYYCRNRFNLRLNLIEPHTILNALSLYSNNLCACVLLTDKNVRKFNTIQMKFAKICEESTEFHFKSYEQQLSVIEECLIDINKSKNTTVDSDIDLTSLNIGDFYLTKHSNLSQVHLIFNLSCDDDTLKQKTDLSSRHPLILGLRNILKACCRYDIKTLTLPLLLTHKMCEEMTINWVLKRAELVLKCLKGFMIEFVQWGSLESRTLQFVVPHDLEEETFYSLSNLIKSIFRESRTVNLS